MMRAGWVAIAAACAVWGACVFAGEDSPGDVMGFEVEGAWQTAPDLLGEFREEELWSTRTIPFKELAGGVRLSTKHVKEGRTAGEWRDHPRYPTIHTTRVPKDWSRAKALSFWAYSEEKTGQAITLAVASDSDRTPWKDYFIHTFRVDWTGWRRVAVPLASFEAYEQPAGWGKVDGIYLFTKVFGRQPNPYTALTLDGMALESEASVHPRAEPAPTTGKIPLSGQIPAFDPSILNHAWPEIRGEGPVLAPIRYASYFKSERALFGYYPRFQPGSVSFSPGGRPYVQHGSTTIQTLGPDGKWTYRDLAQEVVEPYARRELGFAALSITDSGQGNDASIRFDSDGDAYLLLFISDPTKDWRSRRGLLLHSRDGMKNWRVYALPNYLARFEKLVGHNRDCLNRPPVILLSTYFSPTTIFVTIPEKQADGSLVIPSPVKVAEEAICWLPHSGEANQAITHGDQVILVYGQLKVLPGRTQEDGVPAYAVVYDVRKRTLSEPVLIGFGGKNAKDDHNWPAIAVDSKGILHVVINGHHDPFVYTHSKAPYDITAWAEPEKHGKGTSYAGLVCDREDTLYTVTRHSDPGYYFRLSLHRKKAGQPWEAPRTLVEPYKPYYKVWFHKLVIDPDAKRLFLSYHSQSPSICVFKDELRAYLYTWPDREKAFLSGKEGPVLPLGTYRSEPRKYAFYGPPASETTLLVSDDAGETWHLATTKDF